MDIKNITPEEQQFEKEATVDINEEEIRAKVIEEFGFDEATDAERIDKLTTKEVENRKKLSKAIGQKRTYRDQLIEASKGKPQAEGKAKDGNASEAELSQKDVLVLAKADIHDDDLEEVIEFAKFKKISVAEALKNPTLKSILTEKTEYRKSAENANTGSGKRVTNKVTDEQLLADAAKGKVPEKGSAEAERLFWARRGGKKD